MPNVLLNNDELIELIETEHDRSGVDSSVPLTFTNSLTEPYKISISRVNDQVSQYYNRNILELATDADLDEKVVEYGVERSSPSLASDDTYTNFNIFILDGLANEFALDINSPLVIPADAITVRDINGNEYIVNSEIVIEPEASSGFAPITATTTETGEVGAGEINVCIVQFDQIANFDPTKTEGLVFGCRNNKALVSEYADDSDQSLRDRAILRINSMNNTNEDALRLALLNYGIDDVTFKRNMFGFGTIGILVRIGGTAQISETTVTTLNNIIANVTPGARIIVPEYMVVNLALDAEFADGTLSDDTKIEILNSVITYFGELDPGMALDPTAITDVITNITNVSKATLRCMKIDGRKCVLKKQMALSDQQYVLDEVEPIVYVA